MKKLLVVLLLQAALHAQTQPPTYSKGANIVVTWNTGVASMVCGSDTRVVSLLRYSVTGTVPHVSGQADQSITTEVVVFRLTAKPTGGYFVDRHGTANDSADPTQSTALMRDYISTAGDRGTVVDGPDAFYLSLSSGNNPTFASSTHDLVQDLGGKPIILRGSSDCLVMWVNRDYYVSDNDVLPVQNYTLAFRAQWSEQ